jgi:signal transduction histidine kinase
MSKIRVRARAVDMLGRQQIAGIPTSLHELFKNAHDAYADRAEVDFFRADGSLLLRDDGIGMTKEEFESRWLTLGTESKLGATEEMAVPYRDPNKPTRQILGEKGIGRLAIAAIGRMVLILSKAERNGKLHKTVSCLIHWSLFEVPGLDLDDIEIPVEEWNGNGVPDRVFIEEKMLYPIRNNIENLGSLIPSEMKKLMLQDLDNFIISPDILYSRLGGLSLNNMRGTHFLIHPVDPILEADIDEAGEGDFAPPLKKNLIGFCNTMLPDAPVPAMSIAFRDHRADGTINDLINPEHEFFTPADFKMADQHFEGEFDEYGQFNGTLSIYGGKPIKYTLSWGGAKGRRTSCGSFRLKMAYVQGFAHESKLPLELYGPITTKLDQIGGMYVYRDGIRMLPYGNSDYDWLAIERRRTKAAKDYYFSYRRTFGVVEITRKANSALIEKAGREGFMENKAFRQMRDMIQNFLIEVVREYFRKASDLAEDFWRVKSELNRQNELLRKREMRAKVRKVKFAKELAGFFQKLEQGIPSQQAEEIEKEIEEKLNGIKQTAQEEPGAAANELLQLESQEKSRISSLRKQYELKKPAGLGLSKNQFENWKAYLREFDELENTVFKVLEKNLREDMSETVRFIPGKIDQRRRIDFALLGIKEKTERQAQKIKKETNDEVRELTDRVISEVKGHMSVLNNIIEETLSEFERNNLSELTEKDIEQLQFKFEKDLENAAAKELSAVESIRDQLGMVSDALANNESIAEVTSALEEQTESFKDQLDMYAEMAQIGTAVGIVQHEFATAFKMMENYIKQLRGWATTNPQLNEIYSHIRLNFEHLDEYMKAFAPFNRRMHRRKIDISGQELRYYLENLFEDRVKRHHVTLRGTRAFDNYRISAYPSTIYPCFMNLVDNAIYWLTKDVDGMARIEKGKKEIRLDADENGMFVTDSGPGVEARIAERIFEFGYSKKKGGRGMGLYVSREILRRDGFDLILAKQGKGISPIFQIVRADDTKDG